MKNISNFTISDIKYKLRDNINEPILHLDNCHNVLIYNVQLDGNKEHQTSEISRSMGYTIRNNCISLRNCTNITIVKCTLNNSRSGGIVPAMCNGVYIVDCTCKYNYYDGVAPFNSKKVHILNSDLSNNSYCGISIDEKTSDFFILGSTIKNNGDWGIWIGPNQRNYPIPSDVMSMIMKYNIFDNNKNGKLKIQ